MLVLSLSCPTLQATSSDPMGIGGECPNVHSVDLGCSRGAGSLQAILLRAVERGTCSLSATTTSARLWI